MADSLLLQRLTRSVLSVFVGLWLHGQVTQSLVSELGSPQDQAMAALLPAALAIILAITAVPLKSIVMACIGVCMVGSAAVFVVSPDAGEVFGYLLTAFLPVSVCILVSHLAVPHRRPSDSTTT